MSKQWFIDIAMEAPPSALAGTIKSILSKKDTSDIKVTLRQGTPISSAKNSREATPNVETVSLPAQTSH